MRFHHFKMQVLTSFSIFSKKNSVFTQNLRDIFEQSIQFKTFSEYLTAVIYEVS